VSKSPAFVRNAHDFADELSRVLTATITHTPLRGEPLEGRDTVYLRFRPPNEDANFRFVELENDCWVSIYQRLVPSEQDSRMVHTAQYSYTHSLGPNPDHDWLVRYDYDPEKEDDEDYEYPISHVHVNAKNATYDEFIKSIKDKYTPLSDIHLPTERISLEDFIKHLIVKFKIPVLHGKTQREALEILDENRLRFEEKRTR
jgi:hypothetical protein